MTQTLGHLLHIGMHALAHPERPALIMGGSGATLSYGELDVRSKRLAFHLRTQGIVKGEHIAILMENSADYLVAAWAAQRSGLYYTPVNWHLSKDEIAYIINDCGAKCLIVSPLMLERGLGELDAMLGTVSVRLIAGESAGAYTGLDSVYQHDSATDTLDESEGGSMLYSSGTTGRPKGIKRPLAGLPWGSLQYVDKLLSELYGFDASVVYLCPAPLYHAAPLGWSMCAQRLGGTVVVMEKFDALEALKLIEQHAITHGQFVPTMFLRMLNLPDAQRLQFDVSSLKVVVHAGAPCPVEVKRRMFDWLGPIIYEYYAGSEGNGFCAANPEQWLAHPGTVGKPLFGQLHIVGEDGAELPPGEIGTIYFGGTPAFQYHNDPAKTATAFSNQGWSTLGDMGYIDQDGFVFLSDRRTDLIISGGVNIYPRETEEVLIQHPDVFDVAVIGAPSAEFGEDVVAVVQLKPGVLASAALAAELIEFSRARIARFKCPKRVEFAILPRTATGKLLRRLLKEQQAASAAC